MNVAPLLSVFLLALAPITALDSDRERSSGNCEVFTWHGACTVLTPDGQETRILASGRILAIDMQDALERAKPILLGHAALFGTIDQTSVDVRTSVSNTPASDRTELEALVRLVRRDDRWLVLNSGPSPVVVEFGADKLHSAQRLQIAERGSTVLIGTDPSRSASDATVDRERDAKP